MEPIVYDKGNFPVELTRANAYIAFRVGWNDSVQKFNVYEQRSFGWRTNNTTSGAYATFAEAYSAAEAAARALCAGNNGIAILAQQDNAQNLIGSWGMSQRQKDELLSYLPAQANVKSAPEKTYWSEVSADYFESGLDLMGPSEEGTKLAQVTIDAWKTAEGDEQGEVIARVILSDHGDILVDYHDTIARHDLMAQEAIRKAKARLSEYYQEHTKESKHNIPTGIKSSVQISSSNGTAKVIDNLTKAWRSLHEAFLGISEINEGSWKQGQGPIVFTKHTSPELAASIKELNLVVKKLDAASDAKLLPQYLPDELVVRLAHYAGEMEAKNQIAPPEWDDLCSAIRKTMDRYYADPNETNPFHIEDIAEQVFLEHFPIGEKTNGHPESILLPDSSSIYACYTKGCVNAHEQDKRTWQSLDIQLRTTEDKLLNTLCSIDFEDGLGLQTTIYDPSEQESPVFQHHYKISSTNHHPLQSIIRNAETRMATNEHKSNRDKEDYEL